MLGACDLFSLSQVDRHLTNRASFENIEHSVRGLQLSTIRLPSTHLVETAFDVLSERADDYEVIAVTDRSSDGTGDRFM